MNDKMTKSLNYTESYCPNLSPSKNCNEWNLIILFFFEVINGTPCSWLRNNMFLFWVECTYPDLSQVPVTGYIVVEAGEAGSKFLGRSGSTESLHGSR